MMRFFGRKRSSPSAERLLEIESSTIARAGETAARVALEDTLMREGWRVLYLDERFGPLLGPGGARAVDGIALRVRSDGEGIELRLIAVEGGTLQISDDAVQRMKRLAESVEADWLLAAFDGESIRLVPDPGLGEGAAVELGREVPTRAAVERPSAPPAGVVGPARDETFGPKPSGRPPVERTGRGRGGGRAPAVPAHAGRRREAGGRRLEGPVRAPRRPRGSPAPEVDDSSVRAQRSGGAAGTVEQRPLELEEPDSAKPARRRGRGRRGGGSTRPKAGRSAGPPASASRSAAPRAPEPDAGGEAARRGRRRGRRGGRRHSKRSGPSGPAS